MTYLLDANALLALAFDQHVHHGRMVRWFVTLRRGGNLDLATCAITELAFVRVAPSASLSPDVASARKALHALKASGGAMFRLLSDDLGADSLPVWVNVPAKTTDGHLIALAARHGATLATLDTGIPGAHIVPL